MFLVSHVVGGVKVRGTAGHRVSVDLKIGTSFHSATYRHQLADANMLLTPNIEALLVCSNIGESGTNLLKRVHVFRSIDVTRQLHYYYYPHGRSLGRPLVWKVTLSSPVNQQMRPDAC